MTNDRLIQLIKAAISSIENWRIFTSQINQSSLLGRHDWILLYDLVEDAVNKVKDIPSIDGLILSLREYLMEREQQGTPELDVIEWQELYRLIISSRETKLSTQEIAYWAGQYMAELAQNSLLNSVYDVPVADLSNQLKFYADALDKAKGATPFDDDDMNPMSEKMVEEMSKNVVFAPTGISFIDKYIGGFAAREMYSHLSPTGSGKTTISVQVACEWAKQQVEKLRVNPKASLGRVFVATTEDGMLRISRRMLSYLAKVHLGKISGKNPEPLSTNQTLTTKDVEICQKYFNSTMFGESERLEYAKRLINKNLRIIDLTNTRIKTIADNPVEIIELMINRALDSDRQKGINSHCALLTVDHVFDIVQTLRGKDSRLSLYDATMSVPQKIRDDICFKYSCPCWVVHQANGDGNRAKQGQLIDHTHASGAGNYGTHFDVCFNSTRLTEEEMKCTLTCTKSRENQKMAPTELKLEGEIGTLVEIGNYKEVKKKEKDTTSYKNKTIRKTQ